jgi:Fe-S-cluster containining protein
MSERCTGHCCRHYSLPHPLWYVREFGEDGEQIAAMSLPAYVVQPGEPMPDGRPLSGGDPAQIYRCANLNEATGDCRIYEERPRMCREYPYGRRCEMADCSWPAAREGRVDRDGTVHLAVLPTKFDA